MRRSGAGRHRGVDVGGRPVAPYVVDVIGAGAVLLGLAGVAAAVAVDWMPPQVAAQSHATSTAAAADAGDDSGARGGRFPRAVQPTIVPSGAPVWDERKGPVIVDGKPLGQVRPTPPAVGATAPPRPVGLPSVTPPATAPAPTAAGEPAPVGCTVPAVAGCPVSTPPADESTPPPSCTAPQVLDPATNQCVSPEPEPPADSPATVEVAVGDAPTPEPTP